jgi:hypothetical protein
LENPLYQSNFTEIFNYITGVLDLLNRKMTHSTSFIGDLSTQASGEEG